MASCLSIGVRIRRGLHAAFRNTLAIPQGRLRFFAVRGVLRSVHSAAWSGKLLYLFEDYGLDTDRRELYRATSLISVEPKVFDLLVHIIRNRERVVSKDDLIATVWNGRIVSESALTTCINAARTAIGDSGEAQRLIKTLPRKGIRFAGIVRQEEGKPAAGAPTVLASPAPADKPSIAVLP